MAFSMAIDKKERQIIGRALRAHEQLATHYTIERFRIGKKVVTPFELADLIEEGDPAADASVANPSSESRESLATMMAYKLTPQKKLAYRSIERAYEANGISGWLSALREQISIGDFEFNDGQRTHMGSFSQHFEGKECDFYGRIIEGKYLDAMVNRFGIKKPRVSRY